MPMLTGVRQEIIQIHTEHPDYDFAKIGRLVGICRERVRQICSQNGIISPHRDLSQKIIVGYCKKCEKPLFKINSRKNRVYCDNRCQHDFVWAQVECDMCGSLYPKLITELIRQIKQKPSKLFYCSRECWGKKMGLTYGFAAHPENAKLVKKGRTTRKYDYALIRKEYQESGLNPNSLSKLLKIPRSTAYKILSVHKKTL